MRYDNTDIALKLFQLQQQVSLLKKDFYNLLPANTKPVASSDTNYWGVFSTPITESFTIPQSIHNISNPTQVQIYDSNGHEVSVLFQITSERSIVIGSNLSINNFKILIK